MRTWRRPLGLWARAGADAGRGPPVQAEAGERTGHGFVRTWIDTTLLKTLRGQAKHRCDVVRLPSPGTVKPRVVSARASARRPPLPRPATSPRPPARRPDAVRAAPRTAFRPGQSGNPGGRPKAIAEVRHLARQYTSLAIETLASIVQHGDKETARVAAAQALLDRGWGKAVQSLDTSGDASLRIHLE